MKAIVCEQFGPIENLKYTDVPEPEVGQHQLLIDVKAAGVNFPDGLLVQGLYQAKPNLPFIPGSEFSGDVSAIGNGIENFKKGDRVIGISADFGAYAEKIVINAHSAVPIPPKMPYQDAASLLLAHGTAHHALKQRGCLQKNEILLVLGAAGGTGLAAVQIGKAMGAKVIAACSTDNKLAVVKANGADEIINYSECNLKDAILDITKGRGIDMVYDPVGGELFTLASRAMARGGRMLVIGFASGSIPKLALNHPLVKEYSVTGVFWGSFVKHEPKLFASNLNELFTWYSTGKVSIVVDEELMLSETIVALNKVMNREVRGKMVLTPRK